VTRRCYSNPVDLICVRMLPYVQHRFLTATGWGQPWIVV
jgi:hypothetical protein